MGARAGGRRASGRRPDLPAAANIVGSLEAAPFAATTSPTSPPSIAAYIAGYVTSHNLIDQAFSGINNQYVDPFLKTTFPIPTCPMP
jgi:hypothetical protein